jgi:hypothetical protein
MLLFWNSKCSLYLSSLMMDEMNCLLNHSAYAQWVPDSNLIFEQSKKSLYVYCSATSPDEVRVNEIGRDVFNIKWPSTKMPQ